MNNNENNTNQVNTSQNIVPSNNVVPVPDNTASNLNQQVAPQQQFEKTAEIPVLNGSNEVQNPSNINTQPVINQQPQQVVTNPQNVTPQTKVVKVEQVKEVVKEVPVASVSTPNVSQVLQPTTPPQPEVTPEAAKTEVVVKQKSSKFSSFLLILFIIFLFAFVYYLPDISQFIEDYKKEKSGIEDGSMKSGTMTCTLTKENNGDLSTTYEMTLTYTKNKLKKTDQVISYKLTDNAKSTETLSDSQATCQKLKAALAPVEGVDVACTETAVLQKTTQSIDYTKFNADSFDTNVAEYEGFYPEYQLDQSAVAIRKNLEEAGYSCIAREY